jgi:phytoene dehydrogenase-like protein
MSADFDVIVIGGGLSGGLPAAAYLQKAGLQVLIVEANSERGTFCCTHETEASPMITCPFAPIMTPNGTRS